MPEIFVAGAGVAGLFCSLALSEAGVRHIIIDKTPFPREVLCSGLMTWKMCEQLKKFGVGPRELKAMKFNQIDFHDKFDLNNRIHTDKPVYSVYRNVMDEVLLNKIRSMGYASIYLDEEVTEVSPRMKTLSLEGREMKFEHLIMCTNFNQIVGKLYNWRPTGYGVQGSFQPTEKMEHIKIFFNILGGGFAWALPKLDGRVTIGIAQKEDSSVNFISRLMMIAQEHGYAVEQDSIRVGFNPYGDAVNHSPTFNGVWAAGSALGLADPIIGEGMYYAATSGYKIGTLIGIHGKNIDQIGISYNKYLAEVGQRCKESMKIAKLFHEPDSKTRNFLLKTAKGHDGFATYCVDNIINEYLVSGDSYMSVVSGYLFDKKFAKKQ